MSNAACGQDSTGQYCAVAINFIKNPPWLKHINTALKNCNGTNCTNPTCQEAIDQVGIHVTMYYLVPSDINLSC